LFEDGLDRSDALPHGSLQGADYSDKKIKLLGKIMTFRNLNLAASLLCAVLAILLVALPEVIYFVFSLSGDELGNFLAKRAGMLFLGVATLLFFSRNA